VVNRERGDFKNIENLKIREEGEGEGRGEIGVEEECRGGALHRGAKFVSIKKVENREFRGEKRGKGG
jgi:hypothetical protein